jgi:abortive infection bacteriophage resistance protein
MPDRQPKTATTYEQQLATLESRGLTINDRAFALHYLEHLNYYRLSAYRFPLTERGNPDRFLPGTDFTTLWALYEFDRRLRQHLADALKRVEISVRSRLAYVLAHSHGPQALADTTLFANGPYYTDTLARLDEELKRSDELFVGHFRHNHNLPRPPIWAACEVMSFGLLSRFYANITPFKPRKEIARTYKLFPPTMKSFLEHAAYVRNLCAHHSRLWNRRLTVTMDLPESQPMHILTSFNPGEDRKLYNTLVLLGHMMDVIAPGHTWTRRLLDLIKETPFDVAPEMGFPADWRERDFWKPSFSTGQQPSL